MQSVERLSYYIPFYIFVKQAYTEVNSFGENILHDPDEKAHAFIANYQKLGFITDDSLVILKPGKNYVQYRNGKNVPEKHVDKKLLLETISYYKHAANWKEHILKIPTVKQ